LEPASREWPLDHSLGPLAPEYREYASRVLDPARERYLGIHAGSSAYKNLDAKRWPAEHFAELCRRVSTEDGLVPLLFGTAQDREVNATIVKGCPATRIVETPSIRHTAALLQQCEALIANDTAIGHLGTALDVPVVMLTGPTDAREVGPCGPLGITVSTALVCSPCFRVSRRPLRCRHSERYACMKMIAVGRVLAALRAALGKRGTQRSYPLDTIAGNRVALDASKARSTETALNVS
jgi:ADP-heptose:LPS heptosyltransferase